jgi:DNA-binding transcriptional regulator YdaS (Cro superfamily)
LYIFYAMNELDKAISYFEARSTTLHDALNVSEMCVKQWIRRGEIPADRCREIELLTKGKHTRIKLNPFLFGPINFDEAA